MKKILLAFIVLSLFACRKDEYKYKKQVEKILVGDFWRISNFTEAGTDHTSYFRNYNLMFAQNGDLSATNGDISCSGNWAVLDDDGEENNSPNIKLYLYFPSYNYFEQLNEDWSIITFSDDRIELKNKNDHSDHTDFLTLVKD